MTSLSHSADAAVLQRRALLLARPTREDGPSTAGMVQVLDFVVAQQPCAIELSWLREVRAMREVTALPMPSQHVLGITSVRGDILVVFDLASVLGLPGPAPRSGTLLVVGAPHFRFAFLASEIGAANHISLAEIGQRTGALKEFQPGIVRGLTAAGQLLVDGQALVELATLASSAGMTSATNNRQEN